MKLIFKGLTTLLWILSMMEVQADIRLPKILGSNMVLQQGQKNLLWGWADQGEDVTVTFADQVLKTKTNYKNKWQVVLPAMNYGEPFTIRIQGKNTIELSNILVGEVWICSGQSNMGMSVRSSLNATKEISEAQYPNIRLFVVRAKSSTLPLDDFEQGEWVECSPTTVGGFSGVGYFFGRDLHQRLNVPVGLIHSSVGGTNAETWMNSEAVENNPDLQGAYQKLANFDPVADKAQKYAKIKAYLGEFPEKDGGLVNGQGVYAASEFDDTAWPIVNAPAVWSPLIDGIGWYRKEFNLTTDEAKAGVILHLSKLDDNDITWVNGAQVGATNSSVADRNYPVDESILKEGTNILAIRILDSGGSGGMKGEPQEMYVETTHKQLPLAGNWRHKITEVQANLLALNPNEFPTLLYNSMINPLIAYGIKGVVWYQGESNTAKGKQYSRTFPALIKGWRQKWKQGDFPFLFVSLANVGIPLDDPAESNFAELRESQTKTLDLPKTGMALAIDLGIPHDIHPPNKQDVGNRLFLNALHIAYQKKVVYESPMYRSINMEGSTITVSFDVKNSALVVKDRYGYIHGFSVAGADKKFYWAKATLVNGCTVKISSDQVKNPIAVRYGWADNPDDLNLYNKEGLPANPFRSDNWSENTP